MKLNTTPRIPADPALVRELREHARQVNLLSEGRLSAANNAQPSPPTAGEYAIGDFVRNSAPTELGSPGSRYVIEGWTCLDDSPLTFVQKRFFTGN